MEKRSKIGDGTVCDRCGRSSPEHPLLKVQERVPGKATQYRAAAVWWCGVCRAVRQGRWRYA